MSDSASVRINKALTQFSTTRKNCACSPKCNLDELRNSTQSSEEVDEQSRINNVRFMLLEVIYPLQKQKIKLVRPNAGNVAQDAYGPRGIKIMHRKTENSVKGRKAKLLCLL